MHTYFLGDAQIDGYARNLLDLLSELDLNPAAWVTLGLSGDSAVEPLDRALEEAGLPLCPIIPLSYNRSTDQIILRDDAAALLAEVKQAGGLVLLIDGAVHSGKSFRRVVDYLYKDINIKEIASYAYVVKRTSEFVPTFFGLMIAEHDRAFFLLDKLPNHRLNPKRPIGRLRLLEHADIKRQFPTTGTPSIDKLTFADLLYNVRVHHFTVYVYEVADEIVGVLSFLAKADGVLFIDLIARCADREELKIGGLLMRWAENYARQIGARSIELRAIENKVSFYERFFFEKFTDEILDLGDERYVAMKRKLLYNMKPQDLVTLDYLDYRRNV